MARQPITIGEQSIAPGRRATVELELARLHTHTPVAMPVQVVHGRRDGPVLCLSAAIHGDELNGIEIIRRLLALPQLKQLRGTLLAVPVVNVFGVLQHSRYLPDGRDLNRSFPGSPRGSLAARLAHVFTEEVLAHATHAIDLHTASMHRTNFPQLRVQLEDQESLRLARAFAAPVVVNANLRDGSLRAAATDRGLPVMVYEAGEALRFAERAIRLGVRGVTEVMRALHMLPAARGRRKSVEPVLVEQTTWVRAPGSGVMRSAVGLGDRVARGQSIGVLADPFGESDDLAVECPFGGIIIGRSLLPLVYEGDALFHVARVRRAGEALARLEELSNHDDEEERGMEGEPPIV